MFGLILNSYVPEHSAHSRFVAAVGCFNIIVPAEQVRVVVQIRGEVAEPAND
jgi:hypothetical protein